MMVLFIKELGKIRRDLVKVKYNYKKIGTQIWKNGSIFEGQFSNN